MGERGARVREKREGWRVRGVYERGEGVKRGEEEEVEGTRHTSNFQSPLAVSDGSRRRSCTSASGSKKE